MRGDNKYPSSVAGDNGEQVATRNLSVSVLAIEPGPYDYHDETPTVKVTVRMRNTSEHVIGVKPSNWDADTNDGRQVDHKLFVEDEHGRRVTRSFSPVSISPGSYFDGTVYFDGERLDAVLYEPHWLISGEDELIRFNLAAH